MGEGWGLGNVLDGLWRRGRRVRDRVEELGGGLYVSFEIDGFMAVGFIKWV